MSREKQIETPEDEKGASGYSKLAWKLWQEVKLPMTQCETIDRIVREEGYRKQINAVWVERRCEFTDGSQMVEDYYCSNCFYEEGDNDKQFCPNCGARMFGGKNE